MASTPQVVALVGVGNLGRYVFEELAASDRFDVIIIARRKYSWHREYKAKVYISDYTEASVLSILDSTQAFALISFVNCPGDVYIDLHSGFLKACNKSKTCKRFMPSEWAGNIDDYPLLPQYYATTRAPFRKILKESSGIEWTLFNCGWFMDYFLPVSKTHHPAIPGNFPVDPNGWRACIRGTGDELQTWTCGRDIGKAVVELLAAPEWEQTTYVAGWWGTQHESIAVMEKLYGRKMPVTYKTPEDIKRALATDPPEDTSERILVDLDEFTSAGASAVPKEKTLRQREKYFGKVEFHTLEALLRYADQVDFV